MAPLHLFSHWLIKLDEDIVCATAHKWVSGLVSPSLFFKSTGVADSVFKAICTAVSCQHPVTVVMHASSVSGWRPHVVKEMSHDTQWFNNLNILYLSLSLSSLDTHAHRQVRTKSLQSTQSHFFVVLKLVTQFFFVLSHIIWQCSKQTDRGTSTKTGKRGKKWQWQRS